MPSDADSAELAAVLRLFGEFEHGVLEQGGVIYSALCGRLAEDPPRAAITLLADRAFRTPLILLAAVHHLLLTGTHHPLADYYPTVAGDAARPVDDGLYAAFAAFLDEHRPRVEQLVATHSTQTNEVGRTIVTLPALGLVAARSRRPLALLEVGASAGLNLLLDRYHFRIGELVCGDPTSPVQLACEARGELKPPLPRQPLEIAWRRGLDLHPLDVTDPATRAWLRALVWPEHLDRMATLDAALGVARRDPPTVVSGDLLTDLPALAAGAPLDAALVVTSTWVLAYVGAPGRIALLDALAAIAADRGTTTWLVAGEGQSVLASIAPELAQAPADWHGPSTLSLHRFDPDGSRWHGLLAECHAHGRWIRWLDHASAVPA